MTIWQEVMMKKKDGQGVLSVQKLLHIVRAESKCADKVFQH